MALSFPMGVSREHCTPSETLSDLYSQFPLKKGLFTFLYLFLVSWSWQGKVFSLRYPLQRQLPRSSKKTTYLHAYLHKPVWTPWPVAFPSSRRGIKKKFHIISLRINHKLQNADFKFFSSNPFSAVLWIYSIFFCVFSEPSWMFSFSLSVFALHFPPPCFLMSHDHVFANGFSFWIFNEA